MYPTVHIVHNVQNSFRNITIDRNRPSVRYPTDSQVLTEQGAQVQEWLWKSQQVAFTSSWTDSHPGPSNATHPTLLALLIYDLTQDIKYDRTTASTTTPAPSTTGSDGTTVAGRSSVGHLNPQKTPPNCIFIFKVYSSHHYSLYTFI